jgi:hypothetical protein
MNRPCRRQFEGRATMERQEQLRITAPNIDLGRTEVPVAHAQGRPEIRAALAEFRPDGWKLTRVYPAEPGVQLILERSCC